MACSMVVAKAASWDKNMVAKTAASSEVGLVDPMDA